MSLSMCVGSTPEERNTLIVQFDSTSYISYGEIKWADWPKIFRDLDADGIVDLRKICKNESGVEYQHIMVANSLV